ncbi:MAG: alpha/beta fold hydrolase [Acidobacteriota bacterium]
MQFQRLSFKNASGKTLSARLDLPVDEKPAAYALFAHCFTCSKSFNAVVNINRSLTREGFAVLRFDFTGVGESEGDFSETNFTTNVEDIVAAAEFLKEHYEAPKLLIGHSLGGAAVLQAAARIPSAVAVATISAPADLSNLARFLGSTMQQIEDRGVGTINFAGKEFKIKRQFIEDLDQTRMEDIVRGLNKALIIFHSPMDNIVGIENAARLYQTARHPKSFITLDRADHLLSNREDSMYVGSVLAAWVQKYIHPSRRPLIPKSPADNRVVVFTGRHGYQTEIDANGHSLIADEPISVGGSNTGATPYELLVAALGACTSMTLRMYADRKNWPLESVVVRLKHRKVHAEDCKDCDSKQKNIDTIDREVELRGPLSEEQRQRLTQIADMCPVHRTLHSDVMIKTWLKE